MMDTHNLQSQNESVVNRDLSSNKISRSRLKELFDLAAEAVSWAESKGLKRGEQCMFREMCERLWWAD